MLKTRKAKESDYDFLWDLHRLTFRSYVELTWGWNEEWQSQHFRQNYDPSRCKIITANDRDIGCIRVEDKREFLFLDYIAILPEYQNRGLGTRLIRQVLERGAERGVSVRLNVLKVNPARGLYERIGFQIVGGDESRYYMQAQTFKAS